MGDVKDAGSITGITRSPGEGNDNSLQYSCLENPMERGAWWATVHGVTESNTTEVTQYALMYRQKEDYKKRYKKKIDVPK